MSWQHASAVVADQPPALFNLWIDGLPHEGRPTKAHAIAGVPAADGPVPAMVLLHGGGGTAYWRWVQQWVDRGYAAIAVDTSWRLPVAGEVGPDEPIAHDHQGPAPWEATFGQPMDGGGQWLVQAMHLISSARQVLADDERIDAEHIGLMGISWGGFLTCLAAAKVSGFACAVSVYGAGFLTEDSAWLTRGDFDLQQPSQVSAWTASWDPSSWLDQVSIPMLFITGATDEPYPLAIFDRSVELVQGATRTVLPGLKHGHHEAWAPEEPGVFVDSILRADRALPSVRSAQSDGESALLEFDPNEGIVEARLVHSVDAGPWRSRVWHESDAPIAGDRAEATVPASATAWYLNLIDDRGATASTRLFVR